MAIMEGIDLEIQSWFVDPSEIEFCRRPDGSDWLLGEGSYGKVIVRLTSLHQHLTLPFDSEWQDSCRRPDGFPTLERFPQTIIKRMLSTLCVSC